MMPDRLRRVMRDLGLSMMAIGLLVVCAVPLASVAGTIGFAPWLQRLVVAAAGPGGTNPLVSATPPPLASEPAGGPVTVVLNGAIVATQRLSSASSQGSANGNDESVGGTIEIARRTPKTTARLTLPTQFGRQSSVGQLAAEFDTTRDSLTFGPQSLSGLGLAPVGNLPRGFGIARPRANGETQIFTGTAFGPDGTYFVQGVRVRRDIRAGSVSAGIFRAAQQHGPEGLAGLLLGYASPPGRLSGAVEALAERTARAGGSTGALYPGAVVGRVDAGGNRAYASLNARANSRGFATLGSDQLLDPQKAASLTYRSTFGLTSAQVELAHDDRSGLSASRTDRVAFDMNRPVGRTSSIGLLLQAQRTLGALDQSASAAQVQLGTAVRGLGISAQAGLTRLTDSEAGTRIQGLYGVSLAGTVAGSALTASYLLSNDIGALGYGRSSSLAVAMSRSGKRFAVNAGATMTRQDGPNTSVIDIVPSLGVQRRISPVITLGITASLDRRVDRRNPLNSSRSTQVAFTIGAPFALGNGYVAGRANPRLPAAIGGTVVNDSVAAGSFGTSRSGVGNVGLILDGTRSVRSDAQGRFEFRFVTPGPHEVAVDAGTLPRGLTADAPTQSISVAGGQLATVNVGVSAFGSVEGHVYGRSSTGAPIPVDGAGVLLDGNKRALTTASGAFGFGHLLPGPHSVAVVTETLPAFVQIGENRRTVSVLTGERTLLDFSGTPLGAISGSLHYDSTLLERSGKPVLNAYVVAQPGDHAVITDENGTYILDNLPPGAYTLSVDGETLPDDTGVTKDPERKVELKPGENIAGIDFSVGKAQREVVFSFNAGSVNVLQVRALEEVLPPGASTRVRVSTSDPASAVTVEAFGTKTALKYDDKLRAWFGFIKVPPKQAAAEYPFVARATGKSPGEASGKIAVNPDLPIATFLIRPARYARGQFVHVRARLLVEVAEGDRIAWSDGAVTILGKPLSGRVFEFDVKAGEVPFTGILSTKNESLPIVLTGR